MRSAMTETTVTLGTIVKAVGMKGEVKLNPGPDFWPGALRAKELNLVSDGAARRTVHVDRHRTKGKTYILKLDSIDTIDGAESVVGCDLEVALDGLDESARPDTQLPFQVIGLEVRLPDGTVLGWVVDLLLGRGQNCYIVEGEGEQFLIPDVPGIVCRTDLEAGFVEVDPPEGLLELRW